MKKEKYIRRLPAILQTDTNSKFFSATVDQLLSKKNSEYISGYVGRRLGGYYDAQNDYFVSEAYKDRNNYHLEPIAVTSNSDTLEDQNEVFYTDILNRIRAYGGNISNHDRLFESEYYSWAPPIDIDKFLNYQNYYWITGPVDLPFLNLTDLDDSDIETDIIGAVTYDYLYSMSLSHPGSLYFRATGANRIYRSAGDWTLDNVVVGDQITITASIRNNGTYTVSGVTSSYLEVEEDVLDEGPLVVKVTKALSSTGTITINSSNNTITRTTGSWKDDGVKVLDTITMSGASNSPNNASFTVIAITDLTLTVSETTLVSEAGTITSTVTREVTVQAYDSLTINATSDTITRTVGAWNTEGVKVGDTVSVYETLTPGTILLTSSIIAITASSGTLLNRITLAALTYSDNPTVATSKRPLTFTSGLLVKFPDSTSYQGLHRVEAVGREIVLVPYLSQRQILPEAELDYLAWDYIGDPDLGTVTEPWDILPWDAIYRYLGKDYITIERGACDQNPWSRTNSWYHRDVLTLIAEFNGEPFAPTAERARRPIIEFKKNIELYNFGINFVTEVRLAHDGDFEDIEWQLVGDVTIDGIAPLDGDLIVFTSPGPAWRSTFWDIEDYDSEEWDSEYLGEIRDDRIWVVNIVSGRYSLTEWEYNGVDVYIPAIGDLVLVLEGDYYRGRMLKYDGSWVETQQKLGSNQAPLFNLYDCDGTVLDSSVEYPSSDFAGSEIFSYAVDDDSIIIDDELGFPLVYTSLGQISDIVFENDLETERYTYLVSSEKEDIHGYYFYKNTNPDVTCTTYTDTYENEWFDAGRSKQRVIDRFEIINSEDLVEEFELSVLPLNGDVIVKVNGLEQIVEDDYELNNATVTITGLELGDVLEISTYATEVCVESFVATAGQTQYILKHNSQYPIIDIEVNAVPETDYIVVDKLVRFTNALAADDEVTISYLSRDNLSVDARGYYEIPQSLEANPTNMDVETKSYNDFVQHFISIIENQDGIDTAPLGSANLYRDSAKDLSKGSYILQNESSVLKSMLATSSEQLDVVKAIRFAGQEYTRFKNMMCKIVKEMYDSGELTSLTDINNSVTKDVWFTEVMRRVQNSSAVGNTFLYSYMIASGSAYIEEIVDGYMDISSPNYMSSGVDGIKFKIDNYIDLSDLKNVLYLYKQDTLVSGFDGESMMLVDRDYDVEDTGSEIRITIRSGLIAPTDIVYARLYDESSIVSIPPTPSKLGLYTVTKPVVIEDSTIPTPLSTINYPYLIGHDGSRTPMYGDIRDDFLMELETRIYNGIHNDFREQYVPAIRIEEINPGKFRQTNYTREEYLDITKSLFFKWTSLNRANPRENIYYEGTDEWTYNYSGYGVNESNTPAYWRGIFKFYYDTDTPHLTPWKMLGFAEMPEWWEDEYGLDYSSTNTDLWNDLEAGRIRQGPHETLSHELYARPGLVAEYMPVDASGDILSPVTIGLVTTPALSSEFERNWVYGDGAPVEDSWLNTPLYPFCVVETLYLTKPGRFSDLFWDSLESRTSFGQTVSVATCKRRTNADVVVHGEEVDGEVTIKLGYQQWISDRLTFLRKDLKKDFGDLVRALDVKLGHKFGGYTNKDTIKIFAESVSANSTSLSDLLPSENVTLKIATGPSIADYVYSGVLIRALESGGYQVYGYDLLEAVFRTNPAKASSKAYEVNVAGKSPSFRIFQIGNSYIKNEIVKYNNQFWRALVDHTSTKFDTTLWKKLPKLPVNGGVEVTYYPDRNTNIVDVVDYGTKYETVQEVYDFLIGYGSYLKSQGWVFENFDKTTNTLSDFPTAAKQFLSWVATSWAADSVYALSPGQDNPNLEVAFGYPSNVETTTNGVYTILDANGISVEPSLTVISRDDKKIGVIPKNTDIKIHYFRVSAKETEHILTVDNTTVFGDTIYDPLTRNRQNRLRINGMRTIDWFGKYEAPGYMITEDHKLHANFENTTNSMRDYHNVDVALDENLAEDVARHLIGFEEKTYLNELRISEDVQYQFYQGLIREKGTAESIKKLLRSVYVTNDQDINVFEEWALKVAEYGATAETQRLDLVIDSADLKTDPQLVILDTPRSRSGYVNKIQLIDITENYLEAPAVTITKDPDDENFDDIVDAKAISILDADGQITRIDIVNPGSGYTLVPTVTIAGGSDEAIAFLNKDVIDDSELDDVIVIDVDDKTRWINSPQQDIADLWPTTDVIDYDIPNAGYVHLNDVDYTAFDLDALESLWSNGVGPGIEVTATYDPDEEETTWTNGHRDTIWVAKNDLEDWAVYRLTELATAPYSAFDTSGNFVIETAEPLNIDPNDQSVLPNYVVIRERILTSEVPLVYSVTNRLAKYDADTALPEYLSYRYILTELDGSTLDEAIDYQVDQLYYFNNVRFANVAARTAYAVGDGALAGELVWVDSNEDDLWAVYERGATANSWSVYEVPYTYDGTTFAAQRIQDLLVDTTKFKNAFAYDRESEKTIAMLPVYDPFKGILPGIAERNIDFKAHTDPARYTTASTPELVNKSRAFGPKHVGMTWLDLSELRYLYYEQGTNTERRNHWGRLFPGSTAVVYEWTRSLSLPSSYSDEGTVKNTTDYVARFEFDERLQQDVTAYYFWVRSKASIPANRANRSMSTTAVELLLTNPRKQDYRWFAPINYHSDVIDNIEVRNAFVFNNINRLIANTQSVFQINFKVTEKDTKIHKEWYLIREGDKKSRVLDQHWNKMVDSLVGITKELELEETVTGVIRTSDTTGYLIVPDPSLSPEAQRGIKFRPRQSMFVDIAGARRIMVDKINDLLIDLDIRDEVPEWLEELETNTLWEWVDWYDEGFSKDNVKATRQVKTVAEMELLDSLTSGDFIKVVDKTDPTSLFIIYQYDGSTFNVVAKEDSSVALLESVYSDTTVSLEMQNQLRAILDVLNEYVFVLDLYVRKNQLFFALLNYAVSEKKNLDWVFKTTYIVIEQAGQLATQSKLVQRETLPNTIAYINSVKPYHTKIRDYSSGLIVETDLAPGTASEIRSMTILMQQGLNECTELCEVIRDASGFEDFPGHAWDMAPWDIAPWDASETIQIDTYDGSDTDNANLFEEIPADQVYTIASTNAEIALTFTPTEAEEGPYVFINGQQFDNFTYDADDNAITLYEILPIDTVLEIYDILPIDGGMFIDTSECCDIGSYVANELVHLVVTNSSDYHCIAETGKLRYYLSLPYSVNPATLIVEVNGVVLSNTLYDVDVTVSQQGWDIEEWDGGACESPWDPSVSVIFDEAANLEDGDTLTFIYDVSGPGTKPTPYKFRVFYDMFGAQRFYRVCDLHEVTNVASDDLTIDVVGPQLPTPSFNNPGYIWMGNELIKYHTLSWDNGSSTSTIGQLVRGCKGTIVKDDVATAFVNDASIDSQFVMTEDNAEGAITQDQIDFLADC